MVFIPIIFLTFAKRFLSNICKTQKMFTGSMQQIFMKVRCKKDICIWKSQTDIFPFSYWTTRERSSESTGVVNFIKVCRQKDMYWEKAKMACILSDIGEQEMQIQNPEVLSISSMSGDEKVICRRASYSEARA